MFKVTTKSITFLLAMAALSFQACETDDTPEKQNEPPVASWTLTSGTEVMANESLTLNAASSTDPEGEPLSFSWAITDSPQGSNPQLQEDDEFAVFQSDMAGSYTVQLEVTDAEGATDLLSASIVVIEDNSNQNPYIIEDDITEDLVVENIFTDPARVDCIVKGNFNVQALLTVEPGVVMEFEQEGGLKVNNAGAISAVGTSAEPITFTGAQKVNGFWKSLQFQATNDTRNELTHCTVEYGGLSAYDLDAMVIIGADGAARVKITNSTIQHSSQSGISVRTEGIMEPFSNNVVTANDQYPIRHMPNAQPNLDGSSSYIGNEDDVIFFEGTNNYETERGMVWEKLDVPYSVKNIWLQTNLTLQPGVVIEMRQEGQIEVKNGGSFTAVGTSGDKIFINAGEQTTTGFWDQIRIETNDTKNRLEYCNIAYGGREGDYDESGMIQVTNSGSLTIDNTELHHSQQAAVFLDRNAVLSSFSGNEVTANDSYPLYIYPEADFSLSSTSTYSGNGNDMIYMPDGELMKDQTWEKLDVPYSVDQLHVFKHLTLNPGVYVGVRQDGKIVVKAEQEDQSGALTAVGTETDSVSIRGMQHTKGYWNQLYFNHSDNTNNKLQFCHISDAGKPGNLNDSGIINVEQSSVTVENSKVGNTEIHPIFLNWGGKANLQSNTYYNYDTPNYIGSKE